MRQVFIAVSLCLCLGLPAAAVEIQTAINATLLAGELIIRLQFTDAVPESFDAQVLDPARYLVRIPKAPPEDGDVVAAVAASAVPVKVSRVEYDLGAGDLARQTAILHLEGLTHGRGTLHVPASAGAGDTIEEVKDRPWEISDVYQLAPRFDHDQSVRLVGRTVAVDFSLVYRGGWGQGESSKPRSFSVSLEGAAPVGIPKDVEDTPGAET